MRETIYYKWQRIETTKTADRYPGTNPTTAVGTTEDVTIATETAITTTVVITEIAALIAKTMGGEIGMTASASLFVSIVESNLIRKEEGEIRRKPKVGGSGKGKDRKDRKPKDPAALEKRLDAQMNKYWDRDGFIIRRNQGKKT